MVSIKSLVIAFGIALGVEACDATTDSFSSAPLVADVLKPSNNVAVWLQLTERLHFFIPGVACTLGNASSIAEKSPSLSGGRDEACSLIEEHLRNLFPTISCTGTLNFDALPAPGAIAPSMSHNIKSLNRRQTNKAIETAEESIETKINTNSRIFITKCDYAPHPGNCRACVAGYALEAVGGAGVCGATAYTDAGNHVPFSTVMISLTACGGKVIGSLLGSINGCWTR